MSVVSDNVVSDSGRTNQSILRISWLADFLAKEINGKRRKTIARNRKGNNNDVSTCPRIRKNNIGQLTQLVRHAIVLMLVSYTYVQIPQAIVWKINVTCKVTLPTDSKT